MMNILDFKKIIISDFKWINEDFFERINLYKIILQEENKKYNLTRLDVEEKIYSEYFYQSIFVYQNLLKNEEIKLLDVGSGSGIPGIMIAMIFDKIDVTIVESNYKKYNFMINLIKDLELSNVKILNERVENLNPIFRDFFDVATSRAVAPLNILLEIMTPFLKIGGEIIQPKSISLDDEIENSKEIIKLLNLNLIDIEEKSFDGKVHRIAIFKKNKKTDLRYPRKWNEIINGK